MKRDEVYKFNVNFNKIFNDGCKHGIYSIKNEIKRNIGWHLAITATNICYFTNEFNKNYDCYFDILNNNNTDTHNNNNNNNNDNPIVEIKTNKSDGDDSKKMNDSGMANYHRTLSFEITLNISIQFCGLAMFSIFYFKFTSCKKQKYSS